MAAIWTTPRTWVAGELVTAALLNTHLRDNFDWVYARRLDVAIYRYQVASGSGSSSITNGSWQTVPLNTEVVDTANLGTLSSNQVSLVAGTYLFSGRVFSGASTQAKSRLRNITAGSTLWVGESDTLGIRASYTEGYFTIGSTTTIELQTYLAAGSGTTGAQSTGEIEVYSSLMFTRIAT